MKSFGRLVFGLVIAAALSACTGSSSSEPDAPAPPGDPGAGTNGIDPVNGFLSTATPIVHSTVNDGAGLIRIAQGTTATSVNIESGGRTRRYVVVRPESPAAGRVPVLLLLHPSLTSPETMSNTTDVADYVLTQGFWAVLPEAMNGGWNQDPSATSNEDVPFISAVIDSLVAQGAVDGNRVYAAGFSDGGFMSVRLACDLSEKIAAFGINAASIRGTQIDACAPSTLRSKIYFLGTADLIVPYNGDFDQFGRGPRSAQTTLDYWAGGQGCGGVIATDLPNLANDGTTVQLTERTGCSAGTALQLYTITGGGHAWPGGEPTFTGLTTRDIAATGLIWLFVRGYRR